MFSEYASRFLAQSQSRISSFRQPLDNSPPRDSEHQPQYQPQQRWSSRRGPQYPSSRGYQSRASPGSRNPYAAAASHLVSFPFASRTATQAPAPLFFSATDDFREEDDEAEREREVADLYALQKSRRQFGGSRLDESSEVDDEDDGKESPSSVDDGRRYTHGGGLRSSFHGRKRDRDQNRKSEEMSPSSENDKKTTTMFDVRLDASINPSHEDRSPHEEDEQDDDEPPAEYQDDDDDHPPAFQQFQKPPVTGHTRFAHGAFLPYETPIEDILDRPRPRPPSSDTSSIPPSISHPLTHPPRHDPFWSSLFLLSLASIFATFFLIYLHSSSPSSKHPLGDSIYTTLHSSFYLLAVDTVVAILVSLLWLALLRSYIRPLIYTILIAVPIIFISFSIYPFVTSYHGRTIQDGVMRWLSLVPLIGAILWIITVYRTRYSLRKATEMLEFSCRILGANPGLLLLGFGILLSVEHGG
ncbi:MAG: hypothetical protein M1823_002887 [Watsoniomyces obsoletus]|nr:MAG: hypothetical protein M1823_002887 [Watsoniomyces obsoletus]